MRPKSLPEDLPPIEDIVDGISSDVVFEDTAVKQDNRNLSEIKTPRKPKRRKKVKETHSKGGWEKWTAQVKPTTLEKFRLAAKTHGGSLKEFTDKAMTEAATRVLSPAEEKPRIDELLEILVAQGEKIHSLNQHMLKVHAFLEAVNNHANTRSERVSASLSMLLEAQNKHVSVLQQQGTYIRYIQQYIQPKEPWFKVLSRYIAGMFGK